MDRIKNSGPLFTKLENKLISEFIERSKIKTARDEGHKNGVAEGINIGQENANKRTIKEMHKQNYSLDQIAAIFKMNPTLIKKIIAK